MIYKSYMTDSKKDILEDIRFDRNTIVAVFKCVDIVVRMNPFIIDLLRKISEISSFLVTPSGYFRFLPVDIGLLIEGDTNIHEISTVIYDTVEHDKVIKYYLELVDGVDTIYNPPSINYKSENILLNVLKLHIDIEVYEYDIKKFTERYIDKGGSIGIELKVEYNKSYPYVLPIMDMLTKHHLS